MQTLAQTYTRLLAGEGFRLAVGSFMNAFFLFYVENRQQILNEPIQVPENPTPEQQQWAAFCAGAAEYLADRYDLVCPSWAHHPEYILEKAWSTIPHAEEALIESLRTENPEAFTKRNVFCGPRVFTNQHPSSREPGSYAELLQRRQQRLDAMPPDARAAYLKKMAGPPRVHITG